MQSRCVKTKPWERRHLASVAFLLAGKMPALPGFGVLWLYGTSVQRKQLNLSLESSQELS